MDKSELPFISATELASLIKSREVSPIEVTESYLDRIPKLDGQLNSYITVTADRAMFVGRTADGTADRKVGSDRNATLLDGLIVKESDGRMGIKQFRRIIVQKVMATALKKLQVLFPKDKYR